MKYPGNVFMVSAPSGAGKSSLVNALLQKHPNIHLSVSCTTRPPRPGEQDGREYHFVTVDEFATWRDQNNLLEWAEVHGNYYGTPRPFVEEKIKNGENILLEIDWQGARQVRKQFPDIIDIFILPPSIEELEKRLHNRGQDSDDVIKRRLLAASSEIAHADEFEYVIINDCFETALAQLEQIVLTARLRYPSQAVKNHKLFSELGISYISK
ncbi:guanylate kinase [Pelistega europaea]|uniref:Guanylate kinase n=1 Tax=Pelistega europaea TaxID=106147 RepID=A0A7Y4P4K4_9BURK|nr:guanylate kinase [Pelistega europaea]NOL49591.1 guanylate kinase [Pelistega europaea]